ncbi:acetyltransferase, partial [Vibrio cholerae]|nr:acetyltransferase [Vibrio cholerae]
RALASLKQESSIIVLKNQLLAFKLHNLALEFC